MINFILINAIQIIISCVLILFLSLISLGIFFGIICLLNTLFERWLI